MKGLGAVGGKIPRLLKLLFLEPKRAPNRRDNCLELDAVKSCVSMGIFKRAYHKKSTISYNFALFGSTLEEI